MAEGKRSGCKIVPTKDSSVFHLQVCLSSPEDPRPADGFFEDAEVDVAGCRCNAYYMFGNSEQNITVVLRACYDPVLLGGAAKVSAHMVLLDKTGSPAPSMGIETMRREGFYALLAAWPDVKANCVVGNHFMVLCSVDIDRTPSVSLLKEEELPDLGHDLAVMSDKQEFTDVSFDVRGESFSAHRLVLAARSPVFKAELYGPMAESKTTSITVEDMEAFTFRSMLHYMYHGSLPDAGAKDACSIMAQYQHLLVAADRYGVEGLKKICEDKLCCKGITVDSVVSILELAEDHACPKLKTRCFDFLADGDNLKMVAISDEYIRLIQSFPNLLVEVRNRIKKALQESTTMNPGAHKKSRAC